MKRYIKTTIACMLNLLNLIILGCLATLASIGIVIYYTVINLYHIDLVLVLLISLTLNIFASVLISSVCVSKFKDEYLSLQIIDMILNFMKKITNFIICFILFIFVFTGFILLSENCNLEHFIILSLVNMGLAIIIKLLVLIIRGYSFKEIFNIFLERFDTKTYVHVEYREMGHLSANETIKNDEKIMESEK